MALDKDHERTPAMKGQASNWHPSEDSMEKYLLARLPAASFSELEEHLLICALCRDNLDELEAYIGTIRMTNQAETKFNRRLALYSLHAAAGKFGIHQTGVEPEGWIELPQPFAPVTSDTFAIHVRGISMEPAIPDGSLCAFRPAVQPYEGKVVLLEQVGDDGVVRYAVKTYRTSKNADPNKEGDGDWLHERITLESANPEQGPWDVASIEKVRVLGEYVFHFTARAD